MNELTLDDKLYVSSKRAAEMTGYAKDYIGQLCREGRVEARLVGRNWYVLKSALEKHRFVTNEENQVQKASEPIKTKDLSIDNWDQPTYKLEEPIVLPSINKLSEPVLGEEEQFDFKEIEQGSIEAMQDAWRGWFEKAGGEEPVIIERRSEIVHKPLKEAISDEGSIQPQSTQNISRPREALNLRRIREYAPQESEETSERTLPITGASPKNHQKGAQYSLVRIFLLMIVFLAVGTAYVGAGFLSPKLISYKPANYIAGVIFYNNSNN